MSTTRTCFVFFLAGVAAMMGAWPFPAAATLDSTGGRGVSEVAEPVPERLPTPAPTPTPSRTATPSPSPTAGPAAEQSEIPPYTEAMTIEVFLLEVRVEDKDGKFVPGLGVADFELKEDGAIQEIASVREESMGAPPAPAPEVSGRVVGEGSGPSARSAERQASVAIVFDGANSSPSAVSRQKEAVSSFVRDIVSKSDRSDLSVAIFEIMPDGGFSMPSGFTTDRDATLRAIHRVKSGTGGESERQSRYQQMESQFQDKLDGCQSGEETRRETCREAAAEQLVSLATQFAHLEQSKVTQSLESVRQFLRFMGHVPGRRSLLLVSEGFDVGGLSYFNNAGKLFRYQSQTTAVRGLERWVTDVQKKSALFTTDLGAFRPLADAALSSGVALYFLNASPGGGLTPFSPDGSMGAYGKLGDVVSVADSDGLLKSVAADTGGSVLLRAAGVEGFLSRMADDLTRYYVLSYTPKRGYHDGLKHNVQVTVRRQNLRVRFRREYMDDTPQARSMKRLGSALDFPDLFADFPLEMRLTYLYHGPTGYTVNVQSAVPYRAFAPDAEAGRVKDLVRLGFAVRDDKGSPPSTETRALKLDPSYEEYADLIRRKVTIDYRQPFVLEPGNYEITAAVVDERGDAAGARRERITLPAPGAGCLTVSPLMLAARASRVDARRGGLEFDEHGDAVVGDWKMSFPAVVELPADGVLRGLYQIINPGRGADGLPSVEISFRLFEGSMFKNETPATVLRRITDPESDSIVTVFAVPYSGLRDGEYRLELLAKDTITGCTNRAQAGFRAVAGDSTGPGSPVRKE